jgi:hypothetical protein
VFDIPPNVVTRNQMNTIQINPTIPTMALVLESISPPILNSLFFILLTFGDPAQPKSHAKDCYEHQPDEGFNKYPAKVESIISNHTK